MSGDALAGWRRIREEVDWPRAAPGHPPGPVHGRRDGVVAYAEATRGTRGAVRAERLLTAYARVRADAGQAGAALDFTRLESWQRAVLGVPRAPFRTGDAYAKGGRERYGLTPGTPAAFDRCLAQSADPAVPPASRAARVYLDVAFFHPFTDGNGRAALLALAFVLARASVTLEEVGPLHYPRYADDPAGAADLAKLVSVLIRATARHATPDGPAGTPRAGVARGRPGGAAPISAPVSRPHAPPLPRQQP